MKNIFNARFLTLGAIVFIAALWRLIPHAPNLTPIAAIALFGGANFNSRIAAFLVPLASLFLSDLIIGFYGLNMLSVYFSFSLIVLIGFYLGKRQTIGSVLTSTIVSSLLFFAITNFAVWTGNPAFPQNFTGLMACYFSAIPFYNNALIGDLFYSTLLFGSFYLAGRKYPVLAK